MLMCVVIREQAVIDVFEQSTRSVVNVFDVTLQVLFFHLSAWEGTGRFGKTLVCSMTTTERIAHVTN